MKFSLELEMQKELKTKKTFKHTAVKSFHYFFLHSFSACYTLKSFFNFFFTIFRLFLENFAEISLEKKREKKKRIQGEKRKLSRAI